MVRILVVEDDRDLRNGLVCALEREGYGVDTADRIGELDAVPLLSIDVILLDITLPDGDSRC